ncbi:DddA-like double-stranded DNA deaminase toxin [Micromonospora wenchangensis]
MTTGGDVPGQGSPSPQPPAHVEETGRSLPVRKKRTDPTTGVFNGETIVSRDDDASVADLHPYRGGGWPRVLVSHVESHVAARMRRDELDEGELVLNNTTCGTRDFDQDWPLTCDKLLPPVLPAGARLTVWATQDGGRTWWTKTYTGTGERIRS